MLRSTASLTDRFFARRGPPGVQECFAFCQAQDDASNDERLQNNGPTMFVLSGPHTAQHLVVGAQHAAPLPSATIVILSISKCTRCDPPDGVPPPGRLQPTHHFEPENDEPEQISLTIEAARPRPGIEFPGYRCQVPPGLIRLPGAWRVASGPAGAFVSAAGRLIARRGQPWRVVGLICKAS